MDEYKERLNYDTVGQQGERLGVIAHLRNILWSCWYVLEDMWQLIGPTVMMILRLIWRFLKPTLNWLWLYIKAQIAKHPAGSSSIALHLVLIIAIAGGLPSCAPKKKLKVPTVVMVELVPIKDFTNIKPKEAPKPKAVPKSPVKRVAGKPKPPKEPIKPKLSRKPKQKVKAKVKSKPRVKPKSKPAPKVKKPTKSFNAVAAELNKLAKPTKPKQISTDYDPSKPLAQTVLNSVVSQLTNCWAVLPGVRDAGKAVVTVRFSMSKWGTVIGDVKVINRKSDPVYAVAADNAVRAVRKCSPFKGLPIKQHEQWKEMEIDFDPSGMY